MTDRLPDELDQTARVRHRVNSSSADVGARRRINWPAGAALTDDPVNEEIVVNFSAVTAAQSAQTLGLYASSQTTGAASSSTIDARSVSIKAAGAISAGLSAGMIVLSAPNTIAQTNQTVGMYALSQTTGGASSTTMDARTISINAYGAVSAGFSAGSLQLSAPNTIAQTVQSVGLYASSQTVGDTSSATVDARSVSLVGRGAVSLGLTNGSFEISSPNTIAQTNQSVGLYMSGNTTAQSSSSTADARSVTLVGDGAVSVGISAGSVRISVPAVVAQTNQTIGLYALSQTTGGASSTTLDARTLSINAYGAISAGYSNGSIQLSAPNTVAQTNQTVGMYALSQTTGGASSTTVDARTVSVAGQGAVSVGYSAGSLQISAPNTIAQSAQSVGVYALSQTTAASSSSTVDARSLSFNADGIVSVGMSAGSVRISATTAAQTAQSEGWYVVSNTTAASSSSTVDARSVSLSPKGVISAGLTNGSVQLSVYGFQARQPFNFTGLASTANSAAVVTTHSVFPIIVDAAWSGSRMDIYVSMSLASAANTSFGHFNNSWTWAIYTSSASTLTPIIGGTSSTLFTWQSSTGVFSSLTGDRLFSFQVSTALSPGVYYGAVQMSSANTPGSTTASTALGATISPYIGGGGAILPIDMSANPATNPAHFPFAGSNTRSLSASNATIQITDITFARRAILIGQLIGTP